MSTYLAIGLVGNLCSCMVFFKQVSHQPTPCSIYLLSLSTFAIVYLLWSVVPLIYTLDHIDPQIQNLAFCKVRLYGSHVLGQYVRFLIVFACADRFFITRSSARVRALSSIATARKLISIMCLTWLVVGIHLPIFMDIRGGTCWMFDFYKFFYPIYQCTLVGILPPVLMITFGILTIRSLRQRHRSHTHVRQKDRDLMRMLIAEVMINVFTSIPFSANLVYSLATFFVQNKSAERLEIDAFVSFLSQFLIHLLSVAPFYLFIMSSKSFRQEFRQTLLYIWYGHIIRQRRIIPFDGRSSTLNTQRPDTHLQNTWRRERDWKHRIQAIPPHNLVHLCSLYVSASCLEKYFLSASSKSKTWSDLHGEGASSSTFLSPLVRMNQLQSIASDSVLRVACNSCRGKLVLSSQRRKTRIDWLVKSCRT